MQFVKIIIAISAFMLVAGCEDMATSTSTASANSTESGTFSESGNNTACDVCRSDETLELRWVADNMNVVGYKIYYSSEPYISERELTELDSSTTDFDLQNPAVSYHAWNDLALYKGDNVCFRILSYTLSGNETLSQEACGRLPDTTQTAQATATPQAAG